MYSKEKIISLLVVVGVSLLLIWMLPEGTLNVIADTSEVIFFMFALLCMMVIGSILGIEMAKNLRLVIVEKELQLLKEEIAILEDNNIFSIEFTQEAINLQNALRTVQEKISRLQESSHEKL